MPVPDVPPASQSRSSHGDTTEATALDRIFPVVYAELRRVAHRQLQGEATGHTLGTTALVHEVYLRLAGSGEPSIVDRAHFFALAARAMRHVLVDCARRYRAARRGGGQVPVTLSEDTTAAVSRAETMLELDMALDRLAVQEPRLARVVECRFFAGLDDEETAVALGVTARTVRRDWVRARDWLYRSLEA